MKYFIVGKYLDLEPRLRQHTEEQILNNNKSKSKEVRQVSRNLEVILHTIDDIEYLCFSVKWLGQYLNFGSNEVLEIMLKTKHDTGLFPIVEVPINELK